MQSENTQSVVFRFAKHDDCGLILQFIRDLAKYERMENDVVATELLLDEWIFEKRAAEVIFAIADDKEVAFALFFTSFSTFLGRAGLYLEDLFVLPEYRSRGIGTAMLKEMAKISNDRGYGRFEWACLDWNTTSIEFYRSLGAVAMNDWTTYRLSSDAINDLTK